MDVRVDLGNLASLPEAFARAPGSTLGRLRQAMHTVVANLEAGIKEATPQAHGTLSQSMFGEVQAFPNGLGVEGIVGAGQGYAPYVELGTKPHLPPIEPLVDWVRVKLGLSGKEGLRAAKAIRWAIGKRGTESAQMFGKTLTAQQAQIDATFDRAMADIAAYVLDPGPANG